MARRCFVAYFSLCLPFASFLEIRRLRCARRSGRASANAAICFVKYAVRARYFYCR